MNVIHRLPPICVFQTRIFLEHSADVLLLFRSDPRALKVGCTSDPIFENNIKRYPIFSVQIINYHIDQIHK